MKKILLSCLVISIFLVVPQKINATAHNIEFEPANPTSSNPIRVRIKDLPEDAFYFISVQQPPNRPMAACYFSTNRAFEFKIGPFSNGGVNIRIERHHNQDPSSVCAGNGNVIASKVLTVGGTPLTPIAPFQPQRCNNNTGVDTAIGCIPVDNTNNFIVWIFKWAIGIAGGIAFLLMVIASFQIMTASGNPEKLQGGRELLTAAISGLILIIFSVFLLQLIGVKILQIPGLGV